MLDKDLAAAKVKVDQFEELKADRDQIATTLADIKAQEASLRTSLAEREKALAEQLQLINDAKANLSDTFKALSADTLQESTSKFLENADELLKRYKENADGDARLGQERIEKLLQPLKDELKRLDETNSDMEKSRHTAYGELKKQLETITEDQKNLKSSADLLTRALQDSGTAGEWGEMVLEHALDRGGLTEGIHYETQRVNEAGQRPDVYINLPGARRIIVDAKASMKSYIDASNASSAEEHSRHMTDHVRSVEGHIKTLHRKDYSKDDLAPDFVVMFVPSEGAFRAAIESKPDLMDLAIKNNVIMASPTTLLAMARAIAFGWQRERLHESIEQTRKDAQRLYDAVRIIGEHFQRLGNSLKGTITSYNQVAGSLEGTFLPVARRFRDQGIQAHQEIPALVEITEEPRELVRPEFVDRVLPEPVGDGLFELPEG